MQEPPLSQCGKTEKKRVNQRKSSQNGRFLVGDLLGPWGEEGQDEKSVKLGKMKILSVPSTLFFWLEIHGRNENKIILKIYIKSRGILKIISA